MGEKREAASLFLRIIAKAIDFLLIVAVLEVIPKAGFYIGIVYLLTGDGFFDRRSIGKKLLGIRVVSLKRDSSSALRDSILRNSTLALGLLLWRIPLIGWLFLTIITVVECIIMIGNSERMRIGDEIAQTVVIENEEVKEE